MTDTGVQPQRTNRRGDATRENMREAALKALATGDPAAVSANRIAKLIGATWGAVKYQFGDADGLWAAVLHRTAERRADVFIPADKTAPLQRRVAGIIDTLYDGLTATDSRAIENLRAALPRDPAELERLYWQPNRREAESHATEPSTNKKRPPTPAEVFGIRRLPTSASLNHL
jgi:AcrR family transcriptional regulator